jgi:hypothetical protein
VYSCFGASLAPWPRRVDGDDAVVSGEMDNLRREDPMIAGPTVYQNERGAFGVGRSGLEVREAHAIAGHEHRLYFKISQRPSSTAASGPGCVKKARWG